MTSEPRDVFDWWEDSGKIPLPCERCGNDRRGEGSVDARLGCGWCEATMCARCGLIWAAFGPATVEHSPHGLMGHHTLGEQVKAPVARKRRE